MKQVDVHQLVEAFRKVGLREGDGVLIHSAIQFLGQSVGGLATYLHALDEVIQLPQLSSDMRSASQSKGTIAVPAFNFAFARGEPYDPDTTPAEGMGIFSEYIRQHPLSRRTLHPMQSLAVLGYLAEDLASRDTPSAFEAGSAFARMVDADFDILLLGADIQAVSLFHYSEQRLEVPYRYWKDFRGKVKTIHGWEDRIYRMYVRDLNLDPQLSLHAVQKELIARQQWCSVPVNYGVIARCRMADFIQVVEEFLIKDPWSLMLNRPSDLQTTKNPYPNKR